MRSSRRILAAAALACAALAAVLLALPTPVSVGCTFTGLVVLLVGGHMEWRWPIAVGGVMMFAGVFAAALSGVLG